MIFATYWFIAFCLAFFPVYWLIRHPAWRFGWLLVASAVFHTHFAGPAGVLPIVALGIIVYFAALTRDRRICIAGIVICVLALCFYKYTVFAVTSLLALIHPEWSTAAATGVQHALPAAAPLAISFFVFEFVHYLWDVKNGTVPMRNVFHFSIFSIFFPTLVAGPIKRYEEFIPSVNDAARRVSPHDVAMGLIQIGFGFLKKLTADNLTLYIEYAQERFLTDMPIGTRWFVFGAIAMRILLDFSGYSDIAIGLARMMGIRIPANFNWPYLAVSIQDFWKRWHISLSTWIRDYVYIPLGGNRCGPLRRFSNALIAFALCGLWHGPAWNFVVWGVYHGLGLGICAAYRSIPCGVGQLTGKFFDSFKPAGWILTQLFVWFGWLLFFYPIPKAWQMTVRLFVP